MSEVTVERGTRSIPAPVVSPRELLPYAIAISVLMLVLVYFVGSEEGALSLISGTSVHEFVHDARHLLGFPCH
jgi:4-hydroxybenzoate polyprenyltransferase